MTKRRREGRSRAFYLLSPLSRLKALHSSFYPLRALSYPAKKRASDGSLRFKKSSSRSAIFGGHRLTPLTHASSRYLAHPTLILSHANSHSRSASSPSPSPQYSAASAARASTTPGAFRDTLRISSFAPARSPNCASASAALAAANATPSERTALDVSRSRRVALAPRNPLAASRYAARAEAYSPSAASAFPREFRMKGSGGRPADAAVANAAS